MELGFKKPTTWGAYFMQLLAKPGLPAGTHFQFKPHYPHNSRCFSTPFAATVVECAGGTLLRTQEAHSGASDDQQAASNPHRGHFLCGDEPLHHALANTQEFGGFTYRQDWAIVLLGAPVILLF
jgi:hypothetical protein